MKRWKTKIFGLFLPVLVTVFLAALVYDTIRQAGILQYQSVLPGSVPVINGSKETCLSCHSEMTGFSPSHDPSAIGCSSCHLGNPFSLDKEESHKGMVTVPGNLPNAHVTCGKCHADIETNIHHSMMATGRGLVTVNQYVFMESESPDGKGQVRRKYKDTKKDLASGKKFHLSRLEEKIPSEKHLRQLCATCHLNYEKKEPGPVEQTSRGGGCNACHIRYSPAAREQWETYQNDKTELPHIHPELTQNIPNEHCFGCHSRSGRISTNFEGWHETMEKTPPDSSSRYRKLQDGRIFRKMPADIHHDLGFACIDCHSSGETMGNGKAYWHKEEQLEVGCGDCHRDDWETASWIPAGDLPETDRRVVELRGLYRKDRKFLLTGKRKTPLTNVYQDNGRVILAGKLSGKTFALRENSHACVHARKNHENLRCESCHNSWAPQCISCHTGYSRESAAYDHLKRGPVNGRWVEKAAQGSYLAKAPVLGVLETWNGKKEISTFTPGMVLTISIPEEMEHFVRGIPKEKYYHPATGTYEIFQRLHAQGFSHTIRKETRSCQSCHLSSHALGWGEGVIQFQSSLPAEGESLEDFIHRAVQFTPKYEKHPADGLPQDAWIAPWEDPRGKRSHSTRKNLRPFTPEEQWKILVPGTCMSCHDPIRQRHLYDNFPQSIQYFQKCRKLKKP